MMMRRGFSTFKITNPLAVCSATSVGGRAGHVKDDTGVINVKLSLPQTLGGEGVKAGTTTPEHLFASGYAACFGGAAQLMAGQLKLKPDTMGISADVTIGRDAAKGLGLGVELTGHFTGITKSEATQIMEAAHKVCPYSNATRDNIEVSLKISLTELKQ